MPNTPAPRELRREISRSVAVVSDTHVGSRYAIFPDGFIGGEGNNLSAARNPAQRKLYAHFQNFLDVCKEFQVDSVILPGDIMAGTNPKKFGYQNLTPQLDEQVEAAALLLKPLCADRDVVVVEGTEYHGSRDMEIHAQLAEKLKGIARSCTWEGHVANLKLLPGKRNINVMHGASSAFIYREARLGREVVQFKVAQADGKLERYDILLRGHWHEWLQIDSHRVHVIQCPAWQAFYPYKGSLLGYAKFQPDIGGVIILLDKFDRIEVLHFLYPCPKIVGKLRRW